MQTISVMNIMCVYQRKSDSDGGRGGEEGMEMRDI